jgi:hypothetical protein
MYFLFLFTFCFKSFFCWINISFFLKMYRYQLAETDCAFAVYFLSAISTARWRENLFQKLHSTIISNHMIYLLENYSVQCGILNGKHWNEIKFGQWKFLFFCHLSIYWFFGQIKHNICYNHLFKTFFSALPNYDIDRLSRHEIKKNLLLLRTEEHKQQQQNPYHNMNKLVIKDHQSCFMRIKIPSFFNCRKSLKKKVKKELTTFFFNQKGNKRKIKMLT